MTSNTRRFDGTCKCCGRDGLYVKKQKLCYACYIRLRRNGSTDYSDFFWKEGEEHNGWAFIQRIDDQNMLFRCTKCGEERGFSSHFAADIRRGKGKMRCRCNRKFAPRTERQAEVVQAYKDSHYNAKAAAITLGVTRQCVDRLLRLCEVSRESIEG